ncbi:ABC transporter permease, partial [Agreia sp.]|uniref:ABC transporter permease n=1 Tax=Agreia sp. TaxID=1872416 RepID=UPI0035BBB144
SNIDEAEQLVRDGDADAAIVPADGPTGIQIVALEEAPAALVELLSVTPEVTLLEPSDQNGALAYLVGLGFGIVFFMAATLFGTTIAQSVVEEKATRVVEILMSAISARALLAGKVVGNTLLAFGQIVLIAVAAIVGLVVTGQDALLSDLGPSIVWFVVFFAVGFVLLAAMFASAAALVSRQEDIGSVTTPVMMLVMIPYFLIVFAWDNDLILTIMSYVPFSAPIGMPMRIFLGTAEWWEPLLSLVIIVATTVVVVLLGSKIYSNSLLRTGARVKLLEALRG